MSHTTARVIVGYLWVLNQLVSGYPPYTVHDEYKGDIPIFKYPPHAVLDPYRGIYGAEYILFVYNSASVPWITSVSNFWFFRNISETMLPTNMHYISLETSFYSVSTDVFA